MSVVKSVPLKAGINFIRTIFSKGDPLLAFSDESKGRDLWRFEPQTTAENYAFDVVNKVDYFGSQ